MFKMQHIRTPKIFSGLAIAALLIGGNFVTSNDAEAACTNAKVQSWDKLWIREGPGTNYDKVGGIPARECGISIIGRCRWGRWCWVGYDGINGWTNTNYLYTPPGVGKEFLDP